MQRRLGEVAQQLVKQGHLPVGRHPVRGGDQRGTHRARAVIWAVVGSGVPGILARIRELTAERG
jgi:hypothetical protein